MSNIDLANLDRMLELAEFGAKRHNERRQSAFKVIIAYITLLALTLYKTIENSEKFELPGWPIVSLVPLLLCVVHVLYLVWIWMTIKALINDVRRRDFYLAKAESLSYHLSRSRFSDFSPDPNKNVKVNLGRGESWEITEHCLFRKRGPHLINNTHYKEPPDPKWWKDVHFLTLAAVPKIIIGILIYKIYKIFF